MGGDTNELSINPRSSHCAGLRQRLNLGAKYAWILQQHLNAGGSLEHL